MIEIKKLVGILNTDSKPQDVLPNQMIDCLNMRFYGGSGENIVGNTLITNVYLPSGDNEMIGGVYDGVKQRLIWANWNSTGKNGWYQLNIKTGVVSRILESFINSQTDIFEFDRDFPVASINIVYTTDIDGDILTYTARNNRPKAINLLQAQNNIYGSDWLAEYLDVSKIPPSIPIKNAYENDNTVTVNNLRKKLFKFKYRFWFADNEKSTWSSHSEIPVPFNYTDPEIDTDPTKNCRIGLIFQTGDESVVKIEVAMCESLGNVFSNFLSVIILDKSELVIPDNDVYLWRFYNNEAYDYIDLKESNLLFDKVPDIANAQSLLNGNVIVYGGITEGLDPIIPNVDMTVGSEYPLSIDYSNAFSVTQYGTNGFVTGNSIRFVLVGNIRMGQTFTALVAVGATVFTITYTAIVGDTPATVLVGLSASATGQGFTQSSISVNDLVIIRGNQVLQRSLITTTNQSIAATFTINNATTTVTIVGGAQYLTLFTKGVMFYINGNTLNVNPFITVSSIVVGGDLVITVEDTVANETIATTLYFLNAINSSIPAYNASSKWNWAIAYFEDKGKTNQATTKEDFNVSTNALGLIRTVNTLLVNTPYIQAQINHRPPLWAKTYQWLRSENLTKESWLYWISTGTYKDEKYAYISIESINAYKVIYPNSVISYDFLSGDRIKFYVLYDTVGNPLQVYGNEHDYEILDALTNPDVNGTIRSGQYIKILLPTVSSTFNFSNGITADYTNYYIELYTPAKSTSENLSVYYEFGEEYMIIDAGTPDRRHQGQTQNQSADLIIPAAFKFNKGDAWYRVRSISVSNILLYDMVSGSFGNSTILGQKLTKQTFQTIEYVVVQNVSQQAFINNFLSPGYTLFVNVNTHTFQVSGVLNFSAINSSSTAFIVRVYVVFGSGFNTFTLGGSGTPPISAGQQIVINVNATITMPPNSKAYIVMNTLDPNFRCSLVSGNLKYSEPQKSFIIPVIDQNFSDFFPSKVNSNGRPMKVNPDEKTNFFGTLLRWGNSYQQNTNINQINRFYDDDFNEIDRSKGDIQRIVARDRIVRFFQNMAVGQFGVYAKYLQSSTGDVNVTTTNEILTKDNISYYAGQLGLGEQYTGLVSTVNVDYGIDPVRGYHWRLSDDGFTKLNEIYWGQYFIRSLFTPYNKTFLRLNGATAKILGAYEFPDEQHIILLQGGTNNGQTISNYAFSFNEKRNGYCSFYSYNEAEWIMSAQDVLYSWKNGEIYIHNNTTDYCNFFGVQSDAYVTLVFNVNLIEKKSWQSIAELSSAVWSCPIIYGNVNAYAGQVQETNLVEAEFAQLEGMFHAAFKRDINSIGGKINGGKMKGNFLVVKFLKQNASDLITLSEVQIKWVDSPLTNK